MVAGSNFYSVLVIVSRLRGSFFINKGHDSWRVLGGTRLRWSRDVDSGYGNKMERDENIFTR